MIAEAEHTWYQYLQPENDLRISHWGSILEWQVDKDKNSRANQKRDFT